MDLLFQKWWFGALMRPVELKLVPLCVVDESFTKRMLSVVRLFRALLYGRFMDGQGRDTEKYNKFIAETRLVAYQDLLSLGRRSTIIFRACLR